MKDLRKFIKTTIREYLNESYVDSTGKLISMSQDDINKILRGYIESALWIEEEYEDMDEIEKIMALKCKFDKKTFTSFVSEDIDVDSRIDAYNDIKQFIKDAGDIATKEVIDKNGLSKFGMDIYLTRNGHGAGFFDHNYENENILMNSIKKLKSKELYVVDDGKLHFL